MKTDFDVIMRNAEHLLNRTTDWIYIVFEHNEHQIEEILNELSKNSFKSFMTKISSRGFNVSNNTSKNYNVKFNKKEKIGLIPKDEKYQPSVLKHGHIDTLLDVSNI